MKADVNLSILFTDLPLLERPAAAAKAGFDAVELWWPFSGPDSVGDTIAARSIRDTASTASDAIVVESLPPWTPRFSAQCS